MRVEATIAPVRFAGRAIPDPDEKGAHSVRTPGGDQSVQIVSESGLYSLILRSRLDGAVPFRPSELASIADLLNTTARELIPAKDAAA